MTSRTFTVSPDDAFRIALPFDPRDAFGRTRAAVVVAIGGHRYRSTVTTMGGQPWVPFRQSNRVAAGVRPGEPFEVTLTLDIAPRTVDPPADLRAALEAAGVWPRWTALSFTRRREDAEAVAGAKRPDTRARRIARCVAVL